MEAAFLPLPRGRENAGRIADMCEVELKLKQHFFPVYDVPQGSTLTTNSAACPRRG